MKLYKKKDRLLLFGAIALGGITAALSAFISILLQQIIDVATNGGLDGFSRLITVMVIYLAVLGIMGFLEAFCGKLLIRNVTRHLREDIFKGVMHREPSAYSSKNTADYLSALVNDVKLIEENYLIPLLLCSQMVVLFLTTLGILFYLSPLITLILFFFLALMFLIPALLGKRLQKRQDAYSDKLAEFTAKAKDFLNGYEVIRGFTVHPYIYRKFAKINKDTAGKKFSADTLLAVNECFSDILSALSVTVIIFVSAYLLVLGQITMGTLLALIQLSSTFITPVVLLMQNFPKITSMKPILQHLSQLTEQPDSSLPQNSALPAFHSALTCSGLTFGYGEGQPVLKDLHLRVEAGKKYALLGESGCGKSTLIKLLTGYSHEFKGEICYDGRSVKETPLAELNRMASVIHQNVFLFDTDICDNICLGETFSPEEVERALEDSGVSQFLSALDDGLLSRVGENGQNLSGGQRQRIAVARAQIRHTPLLIIDEGTSAVDRKTAHEIERRLLTRQDLTIITITHHMNDDLLPYYDMVLRMEDGGIQRAG